MEAGRFTERGSVLPMKNYGYRVQMLEVLREWTTFADMKDPVESFIKEVLHNLRNVKCSQDLLDLEEDLGIMKELSDTLHAEKGRSDNYYVLPCLSYLGAIKALIKIPNIKIFITCDNDEILESCDKEWILEAVKSRRELKSDLKGITTEQRELKRRLDHEGKHQLLDQKLREESELKELRELEERYKLLCRRVVSAKQKMLKSTDVNALLCGTCSFADDLIKSLENSLLHVPDFLDEEEFENLQSSRKSKRGDREEEEENEHSIELKKQRREIELAVVRLGLGSQI